MAATKQLRTSLLHTASAGFEVAGNSNNSLVAYHVAPIPRGICEHLITYRREEDMVGLERVAMFRQTILC